MPVYRVPLARSQLDSHARPTFVVEFARRTSLESFCNRDGSRARTEGRSDPRAPSTRSPAHWARNDGRVAATAVSPGGIPVALSRGRVPVEPLRDREGRPTSSKSTFAIARKGAFTPTRSGPGHFLSPTGGLERWSPRGSVQSAKDRSACLPAKEDALRRARSAFHPWTLP
jgi:hypothetical protein